MDATELRHAAAKPVTRAQEADDVGDILAGLGRKQKSLPARLFYDDAGCELFARITRLPEYYVTRAEIGLLEAHAEAIVADVASHSVLVEYGASDEGKGAALLRAAAGRLSAYLPIDIAGAALSALRERMRVSHPGLAVQPIEADFTAPLALPAIPGTGPRLGFFPGSTIGNFEPAMAVRFLRQARASLSDKGAEPTRFIVGTDLRKAAEMLVPAYDDVAGVTAAFNRNILLHVNRLAEAAFDPELFTHRALWNAAEGRVEMHLLSRLPQVIEVAGRPIAFAAGESIHTESSYKHTREGFLQLAGQAGWIADGFWTDAEERFGMHRLIAPRDAARA